MSSAIGAACGYRRYARHRQQIQGHNLRHATAAGESSAGRNVTEETASTAANVLPLHPEITRNSCLVCSHTAVDPPGPFPVVLSRTNLFLKHHVTPASSMQRPGVKAVIPASCLLSTTTPREENARGNRQQQNSITGGLSAVARGLNIESQIKAAALFTASFVRTGCHHSA
jgi:hypothetical protein